MKMITQILSRNIGISVDEVQKLMRLSRSQLYDNPFYQNLVNQLDFESLRYSVGDARKVYETHLPELVAHLREEYGYTGKPMTAFNLGNWLVGFLSQPDQLYRLIDLHKQVPLEVISTGLPDILEMLGEMGPSGREWQKALAVLSLPFFAAA
jgi:hypothetical protein